MVTRSIPVKDRENNQLDYSKYLLPLDIKPGDRVVPCPRVSHLSQSPKEHRATLQDQHDLLCQTILDHNGIIIPAKWYGGLLGWVGSGRNPNWIKPAVETAKEYNCKLLLSESVNRYARHPEYHSSHNPFQEPEEEQVQSLVETANGITLMTLLHPNMPPKQINKYQSHRGEFIKPISKRNRRKLRFTGLVKILSQGGLSSRQIAIKLMNDYAVDISHKTIWKWILAVTF